MKKSTLALISLILATVMIASSLAACTGSGTTEETNESEESSSVENNGNGESEKESSSNESESAEEIQKAEPKPLEGPYASTVKLSNSYANGVNVAYPSASRDSILITNKNMSLTYNTHSFKDKLVGSIKNSAGKVNRSDREGSNYVFVFLKTGHRLKLG